MATFVTITCPVCGDPVGKKQEEKGEAFCEDCEGHIFHPDLPQRGTTIKDLRQQKRKEEEQLFLEVMKRLYKKMRL